MTLIEKLEAATEGSRELDAEICKYISYPISYGSNQTYPLFTTSIDAKLPEENIISVHYNPDTKKWVADNDIHGVGTFGEGHTEPLARRIAAVKSSQS